ncbi:transglutaminase-like putative cysteine protease [Sphingomonas zeicaulis]|uniref:transglutaminase family protein n=1 Tax=Sphingomonas zeicaulis TaxID=1632740 RepID=UPI003D1DAD8F
MRLTIHHQTIYRYVRPVTLQPHTLIVTPRDGGDLTTLSRSLVCEPAAEVAWTLDVFGNLIATAIFHAPTLMLSISSRATIDHQAAEWPVVPIKPSAHSYPFTYSLEDVIDLGALAQPDWLTPDAEKVGAWARGFVMGLQTNTLSLLKDLNAGMLSAITYRVRDEEGTQTPAQTLNLTSGSCRDIAGLFIEAARHLGFGARAVSGYLFDEEQSEDDPGSTHAWAEIYLPGAGWIAFDPTHARVGGAQLIPVAVARLNRQIMPVSGGYVGNLEDFEQMEVSVAVKRAPE